MMTSLGGFMPKNASRSFGIDSFVRYVWKRKDRVKGQRIDVKKKERKKKRKEKAKEKKKEKKKRERGEKENWLDYPFKFCQIRINIFFFQNSIKKIPVLLIYINLQRIERSRDKMRYIKGWGATYRPCKDGGYQCQRLFIFRWVK